MGGPPPGLKMAPRLGDLYRGILCRDVAGQVRCRINSGVRRRGERHGLSDDVCRRDEGRLAQPWKVKCVVVVSDDHSRTRHEVTELGSEHGPLGLMIQRGLALPMSLSRKRLDEEEPA